MGDHRLDQAMLESNWSLALSYIKKKQGFTYMDTGWSVLHTAVWKNSPVFIVRELVKLIDPNKTDDVGDSAVHFAVRFKCSVDLLRALLDSGGNPSRQNLLFQTPLHLGISVDSPIELLLVLLQYGADINSRDDLYMTALDRAKAVPMRGLVRQLERIRVVQILCASQPHYQSKLPIPVDLIRKLNEFL
jgi:ankyrin repeat protein